MKRYLIKYIQHGPKLEYQLTQAYQGDTGFDLCAQTAQNLTINPGDRTEVETGLQLILPEHIDAEIRPRSGLAKKHGVTVLNTPGTIDNCYQGTLLINHGKNAFVVQKGDKVAQIVFNVRQLIEIIDENGKRKKSPTRERQTRGLGSSDTD